MLTVSDDKFWQGVGAVELGDIWSLRDELTNVSYVQSTATITSRSGFISHMGMIPYSHGGLKLPGFEVSVYRFYSHLGLVLSARIHGMKRERAKENKRVKTRPASFCFPLCFLPC